MEPSQPGALSRTISLPGRLSRLGFADPSRAARWVGELADHGLPLAVDSDQLAALGEAASPDQALLALVRLGDLCPDRLIEIADVPDGWDALVRVLGASIALGDHLLRHPDHLAVLPVIDDDPEPDADRIRSDLLLAVGADPEAAEPVATMECDQATAAVRVAYRRRLLEIAAWDLTRPEPLDAVEPVAAALADAAGATIEAALAIARSLLPEHGAGVHLAVIGMGKCGGRELNYVSDVDVIYVAGIEERIEEGEGLRVATELAAAINQVCSRPGPEPALWPLDPNLRPEGRQGPLVRTLDSHRAYYQRWAKTWEFQALLKARTIAGDRELGQAYQDMVCPMVWQAVERENFVEDAQAMRRRVEENVPPEEADRQIKLGPGGLRDVEFTVQLLQLVHGRADASLRVAGTLPALRALSAGGYVGRPESAELAQCYRQLRVLEHRLQLHRLRRTHLMPTSPEDRQWLARAAGVGSVAELAKQWRTIHRQVRTLHLEMFYRPLLPATARLSADEAALAPQAAARRLTALGYRDPAGALRHLAALTEGVSRRAAIQRQLLPVMLGWFADGPDPDAGLLAFRRLSDELGRTHWYLRMLRDSGGAGERLALALSSSRYVADALARSPESVMWFADDDDVRPRTQVQLQTEATALIGRSEDAPSAVGSLRALRRRELARTAVAQTLGLCDTLAVAATVTAAADVAVAGALEVATRAVDAGPQRVCTDMMVIAMGSMGAVEMTYSSDADVLFVHRPHPGADQVLAQRQAIEIATLMRTLLTELGPEPALEVDADLRPEGRNGPLVRSLDSYREYYQRWALGWERQALLRARPIAGPTDLQAAFTELIDPLRYPADGLDAAELTDLRRMKARIEGERLPRGVEPARHVKLGPGGLADVEWCAQLLQLRHGGQVPSLRRMATVDVLAAAAAAGLLSEHQGEALDRSWRLASALRDANVLWSGRGGSHLNVLPHDRQALSGVSRLLGYPPGGADQLEEDYLRTARRARAVAQEIIYS